MRRTSRSRKPSRPANRPARRRAATAAAPQRQWGMDVRTAAPSDVEPLTAVITEAFATDPLWRWAIPDSAAIEAWWRLLVTSAVRYPTVWIAGDHAAVAVWIPPGGVELTHAEEERIEPLLRELVGDRTPEVVELLDRFDATHPAEPHYY